MTLCLLAGACALGPNDVAGRYDLVGAGGTSLPSLVLATVTCDLLVTGGGLTLREDRTFELTWAETLDCSRAGSAAIVTDHLSVGDYTLDGTGIALHPIGETTSFEGRVAGRTIGIAWWAIYGGFLFARQ